MLPAAPLELNIIGAHRTSSAPNCVQELFTMRRVRCIYIYTAGAFAWPAEIDRRTNCIQIIRAPLPKAYWRSELVWCLISSRIRRRPAFEDYETRVQRESCNFVLKCRVLDLFRLLKRPRFEVNVINGPFIEIQTVAAYLFIFHVLFNWITYIFNKKFSFFIIHSFYIRHILFLLQKLTGKHNSN